MDVNYILSVCQCAIDDLFIHGLHFHYVSDSIVYSDYHDMRNNYHCNSRKLHHSDNLYCLKHLEVLEKFFSYDVCGTATRFCSHESRAACNECCDYFKYFYLRDAIKMCIFPGSNELWYFALALTFGYLKAFFRTVEKLDKMEMNRWWNSNFMTNLRKLYQNDNLVFLHYDLLHELGVGSEDTNLLYNGNNNEYKSSDFERLLNKSWEVSLIEQWTQIQMYIMDEVLYFARLVIIGRHIYDHNYVIISREFTNHFNKVASSHCLYPKK